MIPLEHSFADMAGRFVEIVAPKLDFGPRGISNKLDIVVEFEIAVWAIQLNAKHYFELPMGRLASVDAMALIVDGLVNFVVVVDIEAKLGFDIVVVVEGQFVAVGLMANVAVVGIEVEVEIVVVSKSIVVFQHAETVVVSFDIVAIVVVESLAIVEVGVNIVVKFVVGCGLVIVGVRHTARSGSALVMVVAVSIEFDMGFHCVSLDPVVVVVVVDGLEFVGDWVDSDCSNLVVDALTVVSLELDIGCYCCCCCMSTDSFQVVGCSERIYYCRFRHYQPWDSWSALCDTLPPRSCSSPAVVVLSSN